MMIPTPPHISRGFQSWEVEEKLIVDISTLLDLWVHDPNGGLLVEDFVEIAQGMVSPLTLVHCRPLVILGKLISIRLKRKLRSELNSQLFRNILLLAMKVLYFFNDVYFFSFSRVFHFFVDDNIPWI